jgi:hypothetical protein
MIPATRQIPTPNRKPETGTTFPGIVSPIVRLRPTSRDHDHHSQTIKGHRLMLQPAPARGSDTWCTHGIGEAQKSYPGWAWGSLLDGNILTISLKYQKL